MQVHEHRGRAVVKRPGRSGGLRSQEAQPGAFHVAPMAPQRARRQIRGMGPHTGEKLRKTKRMVEKDRGPGSPGRCESPDRGAHGGGSQLLNFLGKVGR